MTAFYLLTIAASAVLGAAAFGGETRLGRLVRGGGFAVAAALAFFLTGGPATPGAPIESRLAALARNDTPPTPPAMAAAARRDARENPEDPDAWRRLGLAEAQLGEWRQSIGALERALKLDATPTVYADLADVLTAQAEGDVTPRAQLAAQAALTLDAEHVRARRTLAVARWQEGDAAGALDAWSDLLESLADNDGRRALLAAEAANLFARPQRGPAMVGADPEGGEAAPVAPFAAMMGADPQAVEAMIDSMVERLALRVADDASDLPGWLTLARVEAQRGNWAASAAALEGADTAVGRPGHEDIVAASAAALLELAQRRRGDISGGPSDGEAPPWRPDTNG